MSFGKLSDFSLFEDVRQTHPPGGTLKGKVEVKRAPLDRDRDIKVDIQLQSTSLTFIERLSMEQNKGGLTMRSERPVPDGCTTMNIVLFIKPSLTLSKLSINVRNTAIELRKDLSLNASEVDLFALTEPVAISETRDFSPEKLSVKTVTGRMFGNFPIPKVLSLSTETGGIDIHVPTHPPDSVSNVSLQARSVSSDIVIRANPALLAHQNPAHFSDVDYRVSVNSVSGSIKIYDLPQGSSTVLESVAGSIDATLLQSGLWGIDSRHQSNIATNLPFGRTDLTLGPLLSPNAHYNSLQNPRDEASPTPSDLTVTSMKSNHVTQFGNLHLRYPSTWEGVIRGSTLSGNLDAVGKGLDVVEHSGLGSRFKAVKGNQNGSLLTLETLSGDAEILVG